MNLYKVVLVDDEVDVITAMEEKIQWKELGFEVVGNATNGVKAIEIVEKLQPDVLITDIRMPYMDGLELARILNRDYPNIRIMICTGFDEFEYAREAVHLDINEYMLKPISSAEFSKNLSKLKETLDQEREERLNVKKLADYFRESLPALRSNFFVSLIEGRIRESEYEKLYAEYQLDMKGPLFCCVEFHTSGNNIPEGMNQLLLSMSVEREVKERIAKQYSCQEFIYLGNAILIVELESEEMLSELTDRCDTFCKWAFRIMGAVVTAGIGRSCSRLLDINSSYEDAREAVSYRVLYGGKRAINIGEIVPKEQPVRIQHDDARMHELFKAIQIGENEKIEEKAEKEVKKLQSRTETLSQYNLAVMEMLGAFYHFCDSNFIDFDGLSGIKKPYEKVPNMDRDTLQAWVTVVSLAISEKLKKIRNNTSRHLVTDAQSIVKERYMETDFSLDTVCSVLGVSNSYFSSIFKKAAGESFISYLTNYRMEIAARLMLETNEKSSVIAEKTGYTDANYFSYVFKKKYGLSPSKYRSNQGKKG